jgi:hypothetical protein
VRPLRLGGAVGRLYIPYSVIMALLTRGSETFTVTFRNVQPRSAAMTGHEATVG